jgi:iron complex outermembrane recepter protein
MSILGTGASVRPVPAMGPAMGRFAGAGLAAIALATLLGASPALAQDAAAPQSGDVAEAATPGEIVVTAQRREQKLRDVGIAVSVLNAAEIKNYNITNATDVVRAIPNLKFNAYGSSQVVYNIRGVSQNDYGDQQEPPVAVYQDDAYTSSITTASFPIFDLARVEALRGPQGTLFGRNATGGAVQFISAQPTEQLDGYLSATYGSFNQTILEGAISGALASNLTARVSGQYTRDDGFIKNITPGQPDRGADNHWALRGIIEWKPSSDFKAKLTVRYTQADRERQAGLYSLEPTCPNAQFQGEFLGPNTPCAYWGTVGTTGNGYANPAITPSQGGNPWRTAGTGDAYVDRKVFGATLRLDAKIGAFDVTSITDYQSLSKFYIEQGLSVPEFPYVENGVPRAPGPCPSPAQSVTCYEGGTVFFQRANTKQYTQEVRASATFGQNYLTVGAFGMIIDGRFAAKYAVPFIQYDPNVSFTQRTESFAFFAQDEFKISDQIKLIGGLRYWQDRKRGDYTAIAAAGPYALSLHFGPNDISYNDTTGTVTPGSWSSGSGLPSGVTTLPSAANPTFRGLTARAEIDYKPSDDTLIYASYNRGSKSGGFTFSTGTPFPGQLVDVLNNIPYRPETLNAYEVGLKTKIGSNTQFNLSAFYYDYQNYQAFVQVFAAQVVRNLPAKIKGIEADITSRPIKGLTLQLSGAFQDSEVKNVLLPDGVTLKSSDLPQAPSFAGNALIRYEFETGAGRASLQADALFTSKFCFTVLCAPVEREGGYHVENARIGFTPAGTNLDLAVFVNNVFERKYRVYAFDASTFWGYTTGVYAKPRTWGVNAIWHFGG